MKRSDPNTTTICGSCRTGEHMCGGDCDCIPCFERRCLAPAVDPDAALYRRPVRAT